MNDPHVEQLRYRIEFAPTAEYKIEAPLSWDTEIAQMIFGPNEVTVTMKDHCPTAEAARAAVEPMLRAYEVASAIKAGGLAEFVLRFDGADIVDRDPGRAIYTELEAVKLEARATVRTRGEATLRVIRKAYPPPPERFRVSQDADVLWRRYQAYRRGNESLTGLGYFALTVVEASVGPGDARRRAAQRYAVDYDVLRHLGYLTSEVGDADTARKWGRTAARPHTAAERQWIETLVLKLIERLGEHAADPSAPLKPIRMEDLPAL